MNLREALKAHNIRQREVAAFLHLDRSTVSLKLAGRRSWHLPEAIAWVGWLRQRTGLDHLTVESVFGGEA